MFKTAADLVEAIRLGEDGRLELKAVVFAGTKIRGPRRDDLADELAAFANAHGGTLVLGVDDASRDVLGIPEDRLDEVERFVREVCQDQIEPALMPDILRMRLPGTDGRDHPVIRVDVPRSLFVHRSPGGDWYRVGSSKRQMTRDYLQRLMQQRSQSRLIRFDEFPVAGTSGADLEPALVERFRTDRGLDPLAVLARKLAVLTEDAEEHERLSVAGALLCTRSPERWLPQAYIQAVAYRGTTVEAGAGYQLDAKDITGPLDQQVFEACRFVARNMRVEASKVQGRADLPQYDLTAVFEALVNAVAHRDYSIAGSKIRLRLFADRLEVYSPGALPNTMSVDSMPLRQASRNEVITSLLARCPVPGDIAGLATSRATLMDRRGEGVPLILALSEKLSGRKPVYTTPDDSELVLAIFAASTPGTTP